METALVKIWKWRIFVVLGVLVLCGVLSNLYNMFEGSLVGQTAAQSVSNDPITYSTGRAIGQGFIQHIWWSLTSLVILILVGTGMWSTLVAFRTANKKESE